MKNLFKTRLIIITLFLAFTSVYSQNEVLSAVSELNGSTSTMQFILTKIDENVKRDKHKNLEKNIHDFEDQLNKVSSSGRVFKEEIRNDILIRVNALMADLSALEKTVHKSKLFDSHKEFNTNIENLNLDFNSLNDYVNNLEDVVNESLKTTITETVYVEKEATKTEPVVKSEPYQPTSNSSNNVKESLKNKSEAIGIQMKGIDYAFKYNKYGDIGSYCGKISDLCDDMLGLSQSEHLSESVKEMKDAAHELDHLALQGHAKHDQIHHEYDHLKKLHKKVNTQLAAD